MRNLFILGIIVLGAFMAGWFKVNRDGDHTTIEINRGEIRQDARKAIDRGKEFLQNHELETGIMDGRQGEAASFLQPQAPQGGGWLSEVPPPSQWHMPGNSQ